MERHDPVMVSILWRDAASVDDWVSRDDIDHSCSVVKTVGILVNENKDCLTIALNHDLSSDSLSCFIVIPKAWIESREVLVGAKRKSRKSH